MRDFGGCEQTKVTGPRIARLPEPIREWPPFVKPEVIRKQGTPGLRLCFGRARACLQDRLHQSWNIVLFGLDVRRMSKGLQRRGGNGADAGEFYVRGQRELEGNEVFRRSSVAGHLAGTLRETAEEIPAASPARSPGESERLSALPSARESCSMSVMPCRSLLRILLSILTLMTAAHAAGPVAEALDAPELDFTAPAPWQIAGTGAGERPAWMRHSARAGTAQNPQSPAVATVLEGPAVVSFDWLAQNRTVMQVSVQGTVLLSAKSYGGWKSGRLNLPAGTWSVAWNVAADDLPGIAPLLALDLDRITVQRGAVLDVAAALDDPGGVWALHDATLIRVTPGAGTDGSAAVQVLPSLPRARLARLVTPQARVVARWKSDANPSRPAVQFLAMQSALAWKVPDDIEGRFSPVWRETPLTCGPQDQVIQFTAKQDDGAGTGVWVDSVREEMATLANTLEPEMVWSTQGWTPVGLLTLDGRHRTSGAGSARSVRAAGASHWLQAELTGPARLCWNSYRVDVVNPNQSIQTPLATLVNGTAVTPEGASSLTYLTLPAGSRVVRWVHEGPGAGDARLGRVRVLRPVAAETERTGWPAGTEMWAGPQWQFPADAPPRMEMDAPAGIEPPLVALKFTVPVLFQVDAPEGAVRPAGGGLVAGQLTRQWFLSAGPGAECHIESTPPGWTSADSVRRLTLAPSVAAVPVTPGEGMEAAGLAWQVSGTGALGFGGAAFAHDGVDCTALLPSAAPQMTATIEGPALLEYRAAIFAPRLHLNGVVLTVQGPSLLPSGWELRWLQIPAGPQVLGLSGGGAPFSLVDALTVTPQTALSLAEAGNLPGAGWRTDSAAPFAGVQTAQGREIHSPAGEASWLEVDVPGPALVSFRYAARAGATLSLTGFSAEDLPLTATGSTAPWQVFVDGPQTLRFAAGGPGAEQGALTLREFSLAAWATTFAAATGAASGASWGAQAWLPHGGGGVAAPGATFSGTGPATLALRVSAGDPLHWSARGSANATLMWNRGTVPGGSLSLSATPQTQVEPMEGEVMYHWHVPSGPAPRTADLGPLVRAALDTDGYGASVELPAQVFRMGGTRYWLPRTAASAFTPYERTWLEASHVAPGESSWLATTVTGPASIFWAGENTQISINGVPRTFLQMTPRRDYFGLGEGIHEIRWENTGTGVPRLFSFYAGMPPPLGVVLGAPTLNWQSRDVIAFDPSPDHEIHGGVAGFSGELFAEFAGPGVLFTNSTFLRGYASDPRVTLEVDGMNALPIIGIFPVEVTTVHVGPGLHSLNFSLAGSSFGNLREPAWVQSVSFNAVPDVLPGVWFSGMEYYFGLVQYPWQPGGGQEASMTSRTSGSGVSTFTGPGRLEFRTQFTPTPLPPDWLSYDQRASYSFGAPPLPTASFGQSTATQRHGFILPVGTHQIMWSHWNHGNLDSEFTISGLKFLRDAYSDWAAAQSLAWREGDTLADPDGDGVVNLLEWLGGGNPRQAGPSGITARQEGDGIVWSLPAEPGRSSGVIWSVEQSADLRTWSAAAGVARTETPALIRFHMAPGAVPVQYYRLRATLP